jgi:hypothetical protein
MRGDTIDLKVKTHRDKNKKNNSDLIDNCQKDERIRIRMGEE